MKETYGYDTTCLLYHLKKENGRDYKATIVPKVLIPTVLKEMYDHFGNFGIGKAYSQIKTHYYWPKMIKHIQAHVDSCPLHRREKLQHDKYQLQSTEIPNRPFANVPLALLWKCPHPIMGIKTSC